MPCWFMIDACLARPATLGAPCATTLVRRLLPVACAPLLAAPALAAPSYHISFQRSGYGQQYVVTQSTPFRHADGCAVPGSLNTTFSGSAFAYPGHVGVDNRVEQLWTGPSAAARYDVYSDATTNDFVISGSGGPTVAGQLHLRVRVSRDGIAWR